MDAGPRRQHGLSRLRLGVAARWQHFLRRPPQVGRGRATSGASHLHRQQWSKQCWSMRGGGTPLDVDGEPRGECVLLLRGRGQTPLRPDSGPPLSTPPGWELVSGWPAAGCRSLRRPPEELRAASLTSSRQCCNCVLHVFQMSQQDVASVLCECCKSRSRCFNVADVDPSTQHFLFPMLQLFVFECCGCCNYFKHIFDVANINF
jgi:hypothetical protein